MGMLPDTMKAGGMVYTPYSCMAFDVEADGTVATDIEHIVALAEARDSWIADDRRRDIASDLQNLTTCYHATRVTLLIRRWRWRTSR